MPSHRLFEFFNVAGQYRLNKYLLAIRNELAQNTTVKLTEEDVQITKIAAIQLHNAMAFSNTLKILVLDVDLNKLWAYSKTAFRTLVSGLANAPYLKNLDISSTMLARLPDEAFDFLCESFRSKPEEGKIRFPALENLSINTLLLRTEDLKAQALHKALHEHALVNVTPACDSSFDREVYLDINKTSPQKRVLPSLKAFYAYEHPDYSFSPQAANFFLHFLKTLDHQRKNMTSLNVLDFGENKISRITTPTLFNELCTQILPYLQTLHTIKLRLDDLSNQQFDQLRAVFKQLPLLKTVVSTTQLATGSLAFERMKRLEKDCAHKKQFTSQSIAAIMVKNSPVFNTSDNDTDSESSDSVESLDELVRISSTVPTFMKKKMNK